MRSRLGKSGSKSVDKQRERPDAADTISAGVVSQSELERMQEQIRAYRAVIESDDFIVFSVNREYLYTIFNEAHAKVMKSLYGADIEIGHSFLEYITVAKDRKDARDLIDRALAGQQVRQEPLVGEASILQQNFEVTVMPVQENGGICGAAVISSNITARKHAEQELKRQSERDELILNSAGEGIYGTDIDGNLLFINRRAAEMLGYGEQEIIGKNTHQLFHYKKPDGSFFPVEDCSLHKALKEGRAYRGEDEIFWTRDGARLEVEYMNAPLIENGSVTGAVVVFRDITELKLAEKSLKESEQKFRSFFELTADMACISASGYFRQLNESWEKVMGYSRQELMARPFMDFIHPDDRSSTKKIIEEKLALGETVISFVNRFICKDGSTVWLEWTSQPIPETGMVFAIARNITERKNAEEERDRLQVQLVQAQKMESVAGLPVA